MIIKFYQNYLIKTFVKELTIVSLVFISLVFILNVISEIRFFLNADTGFYYPIFITLLNIPSVLFEIFPFIFLISTQLFFVKLYEKNELIILKNYGIDNLKLLKILVLTSISIGFLITTLFYTFSSSLKHSYLYFKHQHSEDQKYLAVVNQNGLWIKDEIDNKINIINADRIEKYELKDITISQLDINFNLIRTIKASSANIIKNKWDLKEAEIFTIGKPKQASETIEFNTNFNIEKINNMFSDLSSLNFFELFNLHKDYKLFGYSTTEIESHLHNLFSMPIYLTIMATIGVILMFQIQLYSSKALNISIGVIVSVLIYYLNYFINLLGKNEYVPIEISIWMTQLILFIICIMGNLKINEK